MESGMSTSIRELAETITELFNEFKTCFSKRIDSHSSQAASGNIENETVA